MHVNYLGVDVVDLQSAPRGERVSTVRVHDFNIVMEFESPKDHLKPKEEKQRDSIEQTSFLFQHGNE